jgi:hypothetical protein
LPPFAQFLVGYDRSPWGGNRQTAAVLYSAQEGELPTSVTLADRGRDTLGRVPDDQQLQPRRTAPTTAERERTIALLSDRFAQGEIDIDVFEERVSIAHRARTTDELAGLTADLVPPSTEVATSPARQVASDPPATGEAVAIFGGTQRVGRWRVPRRFRAVAFFGGVQIDLRDAELPAGVIDMEVRTTFGGVQIIVPPTLAVEVQGTAIFGGFEHMSRVPPNPDPNAPVLHVRGRAVFGGVSIETRLEGESQRRAHRRRRRQGRQQRHMRRLDR